MLGLNKFFIIATAISIFVGYATDWVAGATVLLIYCAIVVVWRFLTR